MKPIEWIKSAAPVDYPDALSFMDKRVADIRSGACAQSVWLLEHPALYTAGTSADPKELVDSERFDVFETGRGGRYTYHGPGQRIAYVMLDLRHYGGDVRGYVHKLEEWIILTLAEFGIKGERRDNRIGIWVKKGNAEAKIAAIGVRIRHWVSFHGISINLFPDLDHFDGIVPCGIDDFGVTSFKDLGVDITFSELDLALEKCFNKVF